LSFDAALARMPFGTAWRALDLDHLDPRSVRGRLAMYRRLVEAAAGRGALGAHGERSPFWGYAAQLAWQHASGRLGGGDAIAAASWWGACNFALSAIPYAAAMQHDLVPRVAIDTAGYEPALPHWHGAFHRMVALDADADLEPLRFAVWRAHLASIELAVGRHARELAAMPADEQAFARGWIRMVDLFGAAALRTDLEHLAARGTGTLPGRVLADGAIDDLPRVERGAVRRVIALGQRPAWRWPVELAVWHRVMRTRAAREDLDGVLAGMFGRSWRRRLRVLAYAVRP